MLKAGDFVLCWAVFRQLPFATFLGVARDAGFRGITIGLGAYYRAREDGLTDGDIRALVEDHDLKIEYVDGLLSWIPGAPEVPGTMVPGIRAETDVAKYFEVAAAIGAPMVNAVTVLDFDPGIDAVASAFSSLCEKAYPLRMSLEFTPFGAVPDLKAAQNIIDLVAKKNAGIMLDTWHFGRSNSQLSDIEAIAPERYFAIQVSDTGETRHHDLFEETLHYRLLPGRGAAKVAKTLEALWKHGVRLPYDAEIFSDELLAKPPLEAALQMVAAMISVVPPTDRR